MGTNGIVGQRVHLETVGAGDVARLFARTRGARSARRGFVWRGAGNELVNRACRGIDVNRRRHTQSAQVGNIVGEHLGRSVGHRRATQRGIALGKGCLAAGTGHGRRRLERQRRAKVDQAQVKGALGKLPVKR